jgi:hypothetical protein
MALYQFDGKAFVKTLASMTAICWFGATLFALFYEDKPALEEAVKRKVDKGTVYTEFILRDMMYGLGAGLALGAVLGCVGAISKKKRGGIWGE